MGRGDGLTGKLKVAEKPKMEAVVAWALSAELTYWFVLCPLPSPLPRGEGWVGRETPSGGEAKMVESQYPQFPLPAGEG